MRSVSVAVSHEVTTSPMKVATWICAAGRRRTTRRSAVCWRRARAAGVGGEQVAEVADGAFQEGGGVAVRGGRRRFPEPGAGGTRHPSSRPARWWWPTMRRMARPSSAARAGSSSMSCDFSADPDVEGFADFRAVGVHLVHLGIHGGEHAGGDAGAERPAHEATALVAHALLDEGAELGLFFQHAGAQLDQDEAEDFLVAAAIDQAAQRARDDAAGGRARRSCGGRCGRARGGRGRLPRWRGCGGDSRRACGRGVGRPRRWSRTVRRRSATSSLAEEAADFLFGDDVAGEEAAERLA